MTKEKDVLSLDDWKTLNRLVQSDIHVVESMLKMNDGSEWLPCSEWLASELVRLDKIKRIIRQKINTASEAFPKASKNASPEQKMVKRTLYRAGECDKNQKI